MLNPVLKRSLIALALAGGLPIHAHAAKVKVFPVVVDTEKPRATINIVNEGSEPISLEAVGLKISADTEIGVFPPVSTLPPGAKQVFRLILPPKVDSTQHWRVRVTEVSPREFDSKSGLGQVRNELAFEVPVFLSPERSAPRLVREGKQIRNAGNRQILITRIGSRQTHTYLLPGQSLEAAPGETLYSLDRALEIN